MLSPCLFQDEGPVAIVNRGQSLFFCLFGQEFVSHLLLPKKLRYCDYLEAFLESFTNVTDLFVCMFFS